MKQTGGSVASDAVTSLVTSDTYSTMNSEFTNNYSNGGGKQCGGGMHKCPTCGGSYKKKSKKTKGSKVPKAKPVPKKGGGTNASLGDFMSSLAKSTSAAMGVKSNFSNSVFQSQPAQALNSVLPRNVGLQINAKSHFANASIKPTTIATMNVAKPTTMNVAKPTMMNVAKPTTSHFLDPLKVANVSPTVMKNPFTNQESTMQEYYGGKRTKKSASKKVAPKKKVPLHKKKV
jgi:hypothetical protein